MDDTISRQAALDCFHGWVDWHGNVHSADEMAEYKAIEQMPSAQPAIIRCKDCKHYLYPHGCGHIDGMVTAQEDGHCSYAERREDG